MAKAKKRRKLSKREKHPYPALQKNLNLKLRQDEIEIDYLNKLTKEEKEWLNKFNEEYVNATLDRNNLGNNLHNTIELKKDCDRRNNRRKECIYTKGKASGGLKYINDIKKDIVNENYEEDLNNKIDEDLE